MAHGANWYQGVPLTNVRNGAVWFLGRPMLVGDDSGTVYNDTLTETAAAGDAASSAQTYAESFSETAATADAYSGSISGGSYIPSGTGPSFYPMPLVPAPIPQRNPAMDAVMYAFASGLI